MSRITAALVLVCAVGSQALARGPVEDDAVARQLASPDPLVRDAALVHVLISEDADADRVLERVGSGGNGAISVARARQARAISKRLAAAPPDSLAFWCLVEVAMSVEWRDLEPAILLAATRSGPAGRAALLSKRYEALQIVAKFCAGGAMRQVTPESESDKARLDALGARAVPHLLHVLAYDPWSSFFGVIGGAFALQPPGALEQGGAVFALGHLSVREAVPYLLLQLQGPSVTVSGAVAMVLKKLTSIEVPPGKDGRFDDSAVLKWWEAERKSRSTEVDDFVEDALAALLESLPALELMPDYAAQFAQFEQPLGSTYRAIERISGRALGAAPTGALEERLAGIRRTLAAVRAARSK